MRLHSFFFYYNLKACYFFPFLLQNIYLNDSTKRGCAIFLDEKKWSWKMKKIFESLPEIRKRFENNIDINCIDSYRELDYASRYYADIG
jgi:hypothetical protein